MILFEKVCKRYETDILTDCTLSVADGRITALVGASGKGKTTILRLISGLEKPDRGKIAVEGRIGYLFQEPRLLPGFTALENVRFVAESDDAARAALALCEAEALAEKPVTELSGGERQRVALARLVAFGGDIWLLDEPFSALDGETKARILEKLLPELRRRTVLLVTHSAEEAALADAQIEL